MEPVEQVILSVRQSGKERNAEVACSSELVRTSDMSEIVGWFSQDDTELLVRFDTPNLFFHPLPSGDFAVGLIFPSQAGFFSFLQPPNQFYVRVLLVSPRTLRAFGNNPISLYRNLEERGKFPFFKRPPKRVRSLSTLRLQPSHVDSHRIAGFAQKFGPDEIASLVQSLQEAVCTFFSSPIYSLDVIDAVFELFPIRFRTELTFASELMFSTRNPLRVVGVSGEKNLVREQSRIFDVPLISLRTTESALATKFVVPPSVWTPWTQFVYRILKTGNLRLFETLLNEEAELSSPNDLDISLENEEFSELQRLASAWQRKLDGPTERGPENDFISIRSNDTEKTIPFASLTQLAGPLAAVAEKTEIKNESTALLRARIMQHPKQQELLVSVDSCTARALFGDTEALENLKNSWNALRKMLSWKDREQLREESIALVHSLVVDVRNGDPVRSPQRNVNLLDVLLVFLGE